MDPVRGVCFAGLKPITADLGPLTLHSCIFSLDGLKHAVPIRKIVSSGQSSRKLGVSIGNGFLSLFPTSQRVQDAQELTHLGVKKKKKVYFCSGWLLKKI